MSVALALALPPLPAPSPGSAGDGVCSRWDCRFSSIWTEAPKEHWALRGPCLESLLPSPAKLGDFPSLSEALMVRRRQSRGRNGVQCDERRKKVWYFPVNSGTRSICQRWRVKTLTRLHCSSRRVGGGHRSSICPFESNLRVKLHLSPNSVSLMAVDAFKTKPSFLFGKPCLLPGPTAYILKCTC